MIRIILKKSKYIWNPKKRKFVLKAPLITMTIVPLTNDDGKKAVPIASTLVIKTENKERTYILPAIVQERVKYVDVPKYIQEKLDPDVFPELFSK